jgi:hypothetical protein
MRSWRLEKPEGSRSKKYKRMPESLYLTIRAGRQRTLVAGTGALPSPELHEFIGASVATARAHEAFRPAAGSQVLLASILFRKFH